MAQCLKGMRHKWAWHHDFTNKTEPTRTGLFYRIGVYVCDCGATKRGKPKQPINKR